MNSNNSKKRASNGSVTDTPPRKKSTIKLNFYTAAEAEEFDDKLGGLKEIKEMINKTQTEIIVEALEDFINYCGNQILDTPKKRGKLPSRFQRVITILFASDEQRISFDTKWSRARLLRNYTIAEVLHKSLTLYSDKMLKNIETEDVKLVLENYEHGTLRNSLNINNDADIEQSEEMTKLKLANSVTNDLRVMSQFEDSEGSNEIGNDAISKSSDHSNQSDVHEEGMSSNDMDLSCSIKIENEHSQCSASNVNLSENGLLHANNSGNELGYHSTNINHPSDIVNGGVESMEFDIEDKLFVGDFVFVRNLIQKVEEHSSICVDALKVKYCHYEGHISEFVLSCAQNHRYKLSSVKK